MGITGVTHCLLTAGSPAWRVTEDDGVDGKWESQALLTAYSLQAAPRGASLSGLQAGDVVEVLQDGGWWGAQVLAPPSPLQQQQQGQQQQDGGGAPQLHVLVQVPGDSSPVSPHAACACAEKAGCALHWGPDLSQLNRAHPAGAATPLHSACAICMDCSKGLAASGGCWHCR